MTVLRKILYQIYNWIISKTYILMEKKCCNSHHLLFIENFKQLENALYFNASFECTLWKHVASVQNKQILMCARVP